MSEYLIKTCVISVLDNDKNANIFSCFLKYIQYDKDNGINGMSSIYVMLPVVLGV